MLRDEAKFQERWGMKVPPDFVEFLESGLLENKTKHGLTFSRFWWLTMEQITDTNDSWPVYKIPQLVPFAKSLGADHYAWFKEPNGTHWIADCLRDSDYAEGYAPSFRAFVYRSLLQELSASWYVGTIVETPDQAAVLLKDMVHRALPHFPSKWSRTLLDCVSNEGKMARERNETAFRFISTNEADAIVQRDLKSSMLGHSFLQHLP